MSIIFKTTRKEAKINNDLYYFTGKPCKHGHVSKRFTSCGACVGCLTVYRKSDPERELKRVTAYNKKHPKKARIRSLKWRATNKGRGSANASAAKRRAAILKRTPAWLSNDDKREIELIYKIAARVSKETGIKYHVDHKVPLQGETVCGLHVPDNLQLLKAFDNLSKGNNHDYI